MSIVRSDNGPVSIGVDAKGKYTDRDRANGRQQDMGEERR